MNPVSTPPHFLINHTIYRVLLRIVKEKKGVPFAVTGDVDELGYYIARNGRAKAENAVDILNQVIENHVAAWCQAHKAVYDVAVNPSGEEIFIIGLAINEERLEKFFKSLRSVLSRLDGTQYEAMIPKLKVSFGCLGFNLAWMINKVEQMLREGKSKYTMVREYYELLEHMRLDLAKALDNSKFRKLSAAKTYGTTLCRNVTYFELIRYKKRTRQTLQKLLVLIRKNLGSDSLNALTAAPGLNATRKLAVKKLLGRS